MGPNRIGQGIEFDYSCVHAAMTLREAGYETVMVNCNPETVSTDYDTSDRLYFEPLTLEDVLEVVHAERAVGPVAGVIVQLGGQTPLGPRAGARGRRRARSSAPRPRRSTSPRSGAPSAACSPRPACPRPEHGMATTDDEALEIAATSATRCWSGRRTCSVVAAWRSSTTTGAARRAGPDRARRRTRSAHPVLVDRFLDDAVEIDVDALYDGDELYLGGVMEHIEEAGIHSGDSACALPPITLGHAEIERIRSSTEAIARGVGVRGLLNVQYALPATSSTCSRPTRARRRTVPFVSKADRRAAGQGRGPGHDRRHDRRAAGRGAAAAKR